MQKLPSILLGVGLFIAALSIIIGLVAFPKIIESKISKTVRLEEGGETFKKWQDIPIPIYMKIHIFSIQNPKEVMKGAKPELVEMGPYVYQQKRRKVEIAYNPSNDTFFYKQPITYTFKPDMSNGSEQDKITVLNLPYYGVAAKSMKMPPAKKYMAHETLKGSGETMFVNRTVEEFLFKGVYVPFMKELADMSGETLLPNNTFGLYYGKNGTALDQLEVNAGVSDGTRFGKIESWQGYQELPFWNSEYCNQINGSDGALFPPFVTKDRRLDIFSPELCRSLYLKYESDVEIMELPGYRFTLPQEVLEPSDANMCYCTDPGKDNDNCPKGGAFQLQSCRKGTPLIASLPHFFGAAPQYVSQSVGLNPDKEKHETSITLEVNTGVLLKASKRIQMNMQINPLKGYKELKQIPSMYLPIFWVDESAALSEESAERIKGKLLKAKSIGKIVMWGGFGVGLLIIVISGIIFLVRARQKNYKP